jgi:hypothetical protein
VAATKAKVERLREKIKNASPAEKKRIRAIVGDTINRLQESKKTAIEKLNAKTKQSTEDVRNKTKSAKESAKADYESKIDEAYKKIRG